MADGEHGSVPRPKDDIDESLWDSPVKPVAKAKNEIKSGTTKSVSVTRPTSEAQQSHEEGLRRELANVRNVNETIEGVIESLERARGNMKTVNQTVGAAWSLLNTWTRILSQTEHNQRLILDPSWQGASQDIADMEAEAFAKQQAATRREVEEQERSLAAAKRAEEEERKRAVEGPKPPKSSVKARGRITTRGAAASGYAAGDSSTNTSNIVRGPSGARRTTSGIGRGRGARGRS